MNRIASYLPAAVLLLGCALLLRTREQAAVPLVASLETILPTYPGYRVDRVSLTDDEQRVAGMTSYVARTYRRDSVVAFTTFVSYYDKQAQGRTIHSPRNCLPGAGWEIVRRGVREVPNGGSRATVNRDVLKNQNSMALVYYWYQGRGRIVANEYAVKWNLLRDAAVLGHSEETLVRLVVPISSSETQLADASAVMRAADSTATDVASKLVASVWRVLPQPGAVTTAP